MLSAVTTAEPKSTRKVTIFRERVEPDSHFRAVVALKVDLGTPQDVLAQR